MTTTRPLAIALSANDQFKLRYPRYLKAATLAALVLSALMIWFSPRYVPKPYVLRGPDCVLIDIEPIVDVPELPKVAPPPVMPKVIEVVSGPVEDDPIVPIWPRIGDPPAPPPVRTYDGFVASSAKPVLSFFVKADYPEIARHAGLEGTVVVHVLVGPNGKVIDAVVVKSVHPLLDRAAVNAALLCRFRPAKQREIPVKAWLAVPYRFNLR